MSDFVDGVSDGLEEAWLDVITFLPKLLGTVVILLVGWLIARFIYRLASRLLKRIGLDQLLEKAGLGERMKVAGMSATDLVARAVYWTMLLVVLLLASQTLEIEHLSDLLTALISYLPLVRGSDHHRDHRRGSGLLHLRGCCSMVPRPQQLAGCPA